jgi:hypothetical protein
MSGIGIAKKGLGLLKKKIKSGVIDRNVKSKEVFKVMKDIKKSKKKYIKRDPHEGLPSQSSDWPYWRGDE